MPCRFTRHAWPPKRVRGRSGHLPTACRAGGVDGRNKSGHDGEGPLGKTCPLTGPRQRPPNRHARTRSIAVRFNLRGGLCRNGRDRRRPPVVTPDLFRGPGKPGGGGACGPRIGVRGRPGPRNKSGVTRGEQGRQVRACRNPCPDPANAPVIRLYQRLAPGPAHPNRTAVDSFRASMDGDRTGCESA